MDYQAAYVIWLREMKRFYRDRSQIIIGTVRPLSWLFFMGYGMSSSFRQSGGADYKQFVLPGLVVMALLFTSIQSSISIIWDREFGFLKELLVAPIPRLSIVVGKALGGTTLAVQEGAIVLLLSPLVHLRLSIGQILYCMGVMVIVAFALSALGIAIAARMRSFEGFGAIMNFLVMPLFLLSGALYPVTGLPGWLKVLVRLNPLTYGVDLIRGRLVHLQTFTASRSLTILTGFAAVMILSAVYHFDRQES